MIELKLYLYDSSQADYKGTDYSSYIRSGLEYTDDLTEVLDTCQITLVGLTKKESFDPTTKFILEIYSTDSAGNINEIPDNYYHLVVMNDVVEQPVLSDDKYFDHSISFIEASAVAQGRVVDNMTLTYKLKDVSLDKPETIDIKTNASPINNSMPSVGDTYCGEQESGNFFSKYYSKSFVRKYEFDFIHSGGSLADWGALKANYSVDPSDRPTITIPIPLIKTTFGAKNSTNYEAHSNYISVDVKVYSKAFGSNKWNEEISMQVNPCENDATEGAWYTDWALKEKNNNQEAKGYGSNRLDSYRYYAGELLNYGAFKMYYKKLADFDSVIQNRTLSITLEENKTYRVFVCPANLYTSANALGLDGRDCLSDGWGNLCAKSVASYQTYVNASTNLYDTTNIFLIQGNPSTNGEPMLSVEINVYEKNLAQSFKFESAPPVSAYDLFVEAQLKSQTIFKEDGVYIKDTILPYYCAQEDVDMLKNTQIIESAYVQKNFWEVLLEIGKYIHAIPYIEFGEDDRFIVRWRMLGKPIQYDSNDNPIINTRGTITNIYNSKSLENYVSALDSYVDNMVQLGGVIGEWVAAKSESEDYLVYNDVAVIKTSRPIIELLSLKVKCVLYNASIAPISVGQEADITNCVYEKNVYDLLDVSGNYNVNKGYATYYNLGENIIRGLNYRLPSVSSGEEISEYAIKRIIGRAYGVTSSLWKNLRVNDFAFYVEYRTKESVRSQQSRPDLRKYLVNSKYETIPIHNQFNNQQDKMVDSVKFGNQVYGKLIKTGNLEYTTNEWVEYASAIKHAGDLYIINNEIYYISKVETTYSQDHATSNITYSKDYNQLSEIIGIPSEPRFFEISERNVIDRFIAIDDIFVLGTDDIQTASLAQTRRFGYISEYLNILLGKNPYPKYAITEFANDIDNPNPNNNAQTDVIDIIKPISAFSMRNTLSMKWEMDDNFSAGDKVNTSSHGNSADSAYAELYPTQYTDKFGRRDLARICLLKDIESYMLNNASIKGLPISPYRLWLDSIMGSYLGKATRVVVDGVSTDIHPLNDSFVQFDDRAGDELYNGSTLISIYGGDYFYVDDGNALGIYVYRDWLSGAGLERELLLATGSDLTDILEMLEKTSINNCTTLFGDGSSKQTLALVKDCREKVAFNFNTQIITDSDRFVLSGYMWQQKASDDEANNPNEIRLALLDTEVNKIVNDTIPTTTILGYTAFDINNDVSYNVRSYNGCMLKISDMIARIPNVNDLLPRTKAIAFITKDMPAVGNGLDTYFIIARNVSHLDDDEPALNENWYIYPPNSDFFNKQ